MEADITDTSDRPGPKRREVIGDSVAETLRQEIPAAISPERSSRPSANRKRPHSMSRVFQSIRGEYGWRDLLFRCGADSGWIRYLSRSAGSFDRDVPDDHHQQRHRRQ